MGGRKMPADRLKSAKRAFSQRCEIVLDPDVLDEYDKAVADQEAAQQRVDGHTIVDRAVPPAERAALEEANARVAALEVDVEKVTERFRFRGISPRAYSDLVGKHPPTDEQREKSPGAEWNSDTFPAALCQATCESHDMGLDWWVGIFDGSDPEWNTAETTTLFNTAEMAQIAYRIVATGKGSAGRRS